MNDVAMNTIVYDNFLNFKVNHPATKLPIPPITITTVIALTPPRPVAFPPSTPYSSWLKNR
jgi:hypothetical protein